MGDSFSENIEVQIQEKLQSCLESELKRASTIDDDLLLREPAQNESLEGPAILDAAEVSFQSGQTHKTQEGGA